MSFSVYMWRCDYDYILYMCVQGWTLIKHVKFGPDRNEEVVPL